LILIIFPALKMSSYGAKFNMIVVVAFIIPLVIVYQIHIVCITTNHPPNNSIFGVLFILLLSTAISITEVILVSKIATIVISITWFFVFFLIFSANMQVIFTEDIVFPHGIQKLIAVICILLLVCAVISIVHDFKSWFFLLLCGIV
jgi:hypothetical protein